MINPEKIKSTLKSNLIGNSIYYYNSIDSTNSEAKRCSDFPDGSVFIADSQTLGKGRLGRSWSSASGVGIWMSILLKPEITPEKIPSITLLTGLAICEVLRESGLSAYIKWPNDIILNKKKLCGILCESKIISNSLSVILGIGINVNTTEFDEEIKEKATSIFIESGKKTNRTDLIIKLLEKLDNYYSVLLSDGIEAFIEKYKALCITLGKNVQVIHPDGNYEAKAIDITSLGELLVEKDNKKIPLNSCEVSVRGLLGYL